MKAAMSTTWNTKWGARRVRKDPPTIEEALIAAEALTADPAHRVEIAASLMGVSIDEVQGARRQAGRAVARTLDAGRRAQSRGRRGIQAPAHDPARRSVRAGADAAGLIEGGAKFARAASPFGRTGLAQAACSTVSRFRRSP